MLDHRPLISVVVTCYNYAAYVGDAIESVISQEYPAKEILVINDGSTDDSLAVISRYADLAGARARVLDQPNQGHIAACNRGFSETAGEIVVFLDADDRLEPDALAQIAGAWSPSAAKVQYDLKIIDGRGRDLGRRFCHFGEEYDAAHVRETFRRTGTYRWPVTVGNAYARWFLEELLPLTVSHAPDGILNTVAPIYGEVVTIPRALGCYRLHGRNLWSSGGSDHARLPGRILHRQGEVASMRRHADARGVAVPEGNVLDHEIAFINYRLMAWKLGLDYQGKKDDSPTALLWHACRVVRAERLPLEMSVAHMLWFAAFSMSPRPLARSLLRLRFQRAEVGQSVRRRIDGLLPRFARSPGP